jgi:hypothetical protein
MLPEYLSTFLTSVDKVDAEAMTLPDSPEKTCA